MKQCNFRITFDDVMFDKLIRALFSNRRIIYFPNPNIDISYDDS